jgi:hypothetical protein
MSENAEKPKPRKALVIWLILSQLLAIASLLIWLLVAGLSVMAFDSGVTTEAWTVVIVVWSYPIFPLLMVIAAWVAFARRKNILSAVFSGLSFAPPIFLYLFLWVSSLTYPLWSSFEMGYFMIAR